MKSADIAAMIAKPFVVDVPLKIVNPLNHRQHWRAVSRRGNREKQMASYYLRATGKSPLRPPCVVKLVRVYGKGCRHWDDDAVPAAMKHIRDSVAAWLGTDDGPKSGIKWEYDQERGDQAGVRITIEEISEKP